MGDLGAFGKWIADQGIWFRWTWRFGGSKREDDSVVHKRRNVRGWYPPEGGDVEDSKGD